MFKNLKRKIRLKKYIKQAKQQIKDIRQNIAESQEIIEETKALVNEQIKRNQEMIDVIDDLKGVLNKDE